MKHPTWRRLAALVFGHATLRSIEAKLVVLLTMSATIAVALAVGIMALLQYRHARADNEQRMRALIGLVSDSIGIPLAMRDRQVIESALLALRASQDLRAASVIEPDGSILASYAGDQIAAAALRQALQTRPDRGAPDRVDIRSAEHFDDLVLLTKRIGPADRPLGEVVLVVLDDELKHMRFQLGWLSVALIALMALVTLAISQFVQKLITSPLLTLTHVMDRAARTGDFNLRCKRRGDDEIGALTEAFNTMQAQAEIRDRWLARYNEELELTVRERTQQLAQSVQQLQDEKLRVEQANAAKTRFLAVISHEIRTPLNGVQGMAELLSHTPLQVKQQQMLGAIRRSSDALLAMLNSVLDYSKLEAGHLDATYVSVRLRPLVQELCDVFTAQAAHKGLSFQCIVSDEIPDLINTDPIRLRQILVNLLSNALKFTHMGWVSLAIDLDKRTMGPSPDTIALCFAVVDTGIGIRNGDLDRIFQPFCQADDSTSRRYGGTGLGLAIARELSELLGGTLTVSSHWGHGSRFELKLSVGCDQEAEAVAAGSVTTCANEALTADCCHAANASGMVPATEVSPSHDAGIATALGLHVLVVDDDAINQSITAGLLEQVGCTACCAADGATALILLEQRHFDVVLMDCQMPVMDGYETTQRWRQREAARDMPALPIIALTADALSTSHTKCIAAGMQGYLCKPCSATHLRNILCQAIKGEGLTSVLAAPDMTITGGPCHPGLAPNTASSAIPEPVARPASPPDLTTGQASNRARTASTPQALSFDEQTVHTILTFEAMRQPERFHALVDDFCADAMRRWDEARHASGSGDHALAHRHLHTLKSSSASLGLLSLSALLADLDQCARQHDDPQLQLWHVEFQRQLGAAAVWLRDIGPNLAKPSPQQTMTASSSTSAVSPAAFNPPSAGASSSPASSLHRAQTNSALV